MNPSFSKIFRKRLWHGLKEIKIILSELSESLEQALEDDNISKEVYDNLKPGVDCIGHEIYEIEANGGRELEKMKLEEKNSEKDSN